MKKKLKTLLNSMFIFGLIGLGSTSVLSASASVEESEVGRVDKQLSISDSSSISIDLSSADVYVDVSSDDIVHITYYNTERYTYEIEQRNNELVLKQTTPWFGINFEKPRDVTVLIPAQFNGELNVKTSSGNIYIDTVSGISIDLDASSGDIEAMHISSKEDISVRASSGGINLRDATSEGGTLSVNTSSGNMNIDTISARKIELAASSGNIEAMHIFSKEDISVRASSGGINLRDATSEGGTLSVNTSSGGMDIDTISARRIDLDANSGRIEAKHIVCNDIDVEGSSGGIEFSELDAQNITIDSSSGGVLGSIVGSESDFSVTSRTGSGRNNLPTEWEQGSKMLDVSTNSGNVKISFTE